MKKFLSVFLATLMIVSVATAAFCASAAYDNWNTGMTDIPNIYVQGQGRAIINEDGTVVYDKKQSALGGSALDPDFDLMTTIKDYLPYFKNAVLNDEWDEYNEKMVGLADQIYGGVALDSNGDPKNGSHIIDDFSYMSQQDRLAANGKYALRGYNYYIDWRLDPFETADLLNVYIENVLSTTGKDKVNLFSRCEGCNIVAAYLDKYGTDCVNCCTFYINTVYGIDDISGLFSGNIAIEGEALQAFKAQGNYSIGDEVVNALIDSLFDVLVDTYSFDAFSLSTTPLIQKIYEETLSKFLLHSYATMPGIWAMIRADDYARAKKYIFAGVEEEYAGLIEKLDYYDKHVRSRADELFKEAEASGAKIQFIGKYGDYAMKPITENCREVSDGVVLLSHTAPGATVAKKGRTLSKKYIKKAEKNGNYAYISADRVVDCSTCLFPDTTWVVYNSKHSEFPWCVDEIAAEFFASDGTMTVSSRDRFPQYTTYVADGDCLVPLTAENGAQPNTEPAHTEETIKAKVAEFVRLIIDVFKQIIKGEIRLSEILSSFDY